jgi:DNA-binding IclR family transcriptional regulator
MTAHLGVLDGDMVTYLIKESASQVDLFTRENMQLEAYCSAIGKILLAHLTAPALAAYLAAGPFVRLTPNTVIDPAEIQGHLEMVRQTDIAIDNQEVAEDLVCLAVPTRSSTGQVIAAISCSQMPPFPERNARIPSLRVSATAIETSISFEHDDSSNIKILSAIIECPVSANVSP